MTQEEGDDNYRFPQENDKSSEDEEYPRPRNTYEKVSEMSLMFMVLSMLSFMIMQEYLVDSEQLFFASIIGVAAIITGLTSYKGNKIGKTDR